MKTINKSILPLILLIVAVSCSNETITEKGPKGSLFIIGGGTRPPEMIRDMIRLTGVDTAGHIVVLPMASSEPDTVTYYGELQFRKQGITKIFTVISGKKGLSGYQDSLIRNASLIYITGGDQAKFMDSVRNTNAEDALWHAYEKGAMISGTSAGAAVQSKLMITGDQKKYPVYTGDFPTIEADNMILAEGLGFTENIIIDQHFIQRQRLNRLIAVILENPTKTGIGIDESTAIHVKGNNIKVYGESQVIVLEGNNTEPKIQNGLLGNKNLKISIYLPGEVFSIN